MKRLTKADVEYLHGQPCFGCWWSHLDPYDWCLRCCNGESEHCGKFCPKARCEHYEKTRCEHYGKAWK
jgi:hypothetical protein